MLGTGYYDFDKPLDAKIPGLENFKGTTVHPQFWPEDLDYKGKKMVIIGSGATAVTIVPAVVDEGVGSVTMLQRSPSYILSMPQRKPTDPIPLFERILPTSASLRLKRLGFVFIGWAIYLFCQAFPARARRIIAKEAKKVLPRDFPMDPHFAPKYNPWDQRLCFCPDNDFYLSLGTGRAHVVTDTIKRVVSDGIELASGQKLDADIIVTATGLNLSFCGKIDVTVDKKPVHIPDQYLWRTAMITGLPNLSVSIGYINASWALGSDTTARLTTRLIKYMLDNGYTSVIPEITPEEMKDPLSPLALASTYVKASQHKIPHAGRTGPWKPRNNFFQDSWNADRADLRQGLKFSKVST